MATYKPWFKINSGMFKRLRAKWASELCAEHDGTVADFQKLGEQLVDLADYSYFFERSKYNLLYAGKVAGGIVLGCAVTGPIAYLAVPGIASALGALGIGRPKMASDA